MDIQKATHSAAGGIDRIGSTIERINNIQSSIAAAVEQQGSATREISRNVQEAAGKTARVSDSIVHVSRALETTGLAATEMLDAANSLSEQSAMLKGEVDAFLLSVRGDGKGMRDAEKTQVDGQKPSAHLRRVA